MKTAKNYQDIYGIWAVTTEGDCEGRTTKNLGTHEGYVDEIALHLADKAFYSLRFHKTEKIENYIPTKKSVNVSFDIDSETWDMTPDKREAEMKQIFKDRPCFISKGMSYAAFEISTIKKRR